MREDTPQAGVLLLTSKILDDSAALTGPAFARWGEATCVPSVQATGGVSYTLRYESLEFMKQHRSAKGNTSGRDLEPGHMNCHYDFLDVYFMQDINFSNSNAFRQLPIIGDTEIDGNMDASKLLERLLMQTEFKMRLCAAAEPEASHTSTTTPAPFLVTVAAPSGQLPDWVGTMGNVMGRYHVQSASTLSALERSQASGTLQDEIALIACNSLKSFQAAAVGDPGSDLEIGLWGLRRQYSGDEKQPAAWRPGVRI